MEYSGKKILVVDDSLELAEMVTRFLENCKFDTSFVLNGEGAIEKVLSDSPDLVLLDLNLPDISGIEVLKRIKKIDEDIVIIVITGYGGEQIAVDVMKAGAVDFLSKPVDRETLLKAVKDAFKMHDARIEDKRHDGFSPMEKFFPFLAHEVRNPLHAMGGALAVIQKRSDPKDPTLTQAIKIIHEEIQHLSGFVQECLDFVRPPVEARFIPIEINEVLSVAVNIVSHMFQGLSKKIKITFELTPELPVVTANYEELKQAFLNILKNSFEAMEQGGGMVIQTSLKSDSSAKWIEVVFTDSGPGIKKESLERLPSPFYTTKMRGTGLGLAICQRVFVERHRGSFHIESKEGKGTTVVVGLPLGTLGRTARGDSHD